MGLAAPTRTGLTTSASPNDSTRPIAPLGGDTAGTRDDSVVLELDAAKTEKER
jgi:hypothetical protein